MEVCDGCSEGTHQGGSGQAGWRYRLRQRAQCSQCDRGGQEEVLCPPAQGMGRTLFVGQGKKTHCSSYVFGLMAGFFIKESLVIRLGNEIIYSYFTLSFRKHSFK